MLNVVFTFAVIFGLQLTTVWQPLAESDFVIAPKITSDTFSTEPTEVGNERAEQYWDCPLCSLTPPLFVQNQVPPAPGPSSNHGWRQPPPVFLSRRYGHHRPPHPARDR